MSFLRPGVIKLHKLKLTLQFKFIINKIMMISKVAKMHLTCHWKVITFVTLNCISYGKICSKISEVNLSTFIYRLSHEDFSSIDGRSMFNMFTCDRSDANWSWLIRKLQRMSREQESFTYFYVHYAFIILNLSFVEHGYNVITLAPTSGTYRNADPSHCTQGYCISPQENIMSI